MSSRRSFSDKVKFEIVLEVLKGQRAVTEIASQYEVHPTMISRWKKEFLEKGSSVFATGKSEAESDWEDERERLMKKIGEKEMELDFVKKNLKRLGIR
jgi:transposase-like protein